MLKYSILLLFTASLMFSCKNSSKKTEQDQKQEVTLYTHRHYDSDKVIFEKFEQKTGIQINVVKASADALIQKLESEGKQTPADLLLTVDAGRLVRAKNKGLLQSVDSKVLESRIPSYLKDQENEWFGLTKRARIIAYSKERVNPEELTTYKALTESKWKNKILIRASSNIYNQSLLASIIANNGNTEAKKWAEGIITNFARVPKGNDRDQIKAILAGEGDLAIVNTYYIGKLLNSKDPVEVNAAKAVGLFFPNQDDSGTHINISGIGVTKHAPNSANAIKFMEYLVSKEVQEIFAKTNYEYPVNAAANTSELLTSWGNFKEDHLSLTKLGELNKAAVITFDEVAWDKGPNAQ